MTTQPPSDQPPERPRDQIYADYSPNQGDLVDFAFDQRVAAVFPDMIRRSVPGYELVVASTGLLAARFAQPDSNLYDLGASLGASSLAMQRQVRSPGTRIIAVDNAPAMLERARQTITNNNLQGPAVDLVCADILNVAISNASVVVLNFTLQFVPPVQRLGLLQRIHAGLRPGGVLLLAEKMRSTDPQLQQLLDDTHLDFKRANGYSELEISSKRSAIEQVMQPDTAEQQAARLRQAGFQRCHTWFQALNFQAVLAHA